MTDEVKVLATTEIPPATKKAYEALQKTDYLNQDEVVWDPATEKMLKRLGTTGIPPNKEWLKKVRKLVNRSFSADSRRLPEPGKILDPSP